MSGRPDDGGVDDIRIGSLIRTLRHRLGWRQSDLAIRSGVSQGLVSLAERGRLDEVSPRRLRRILRELDAELVMIVRWRGGDLDRLADEGHARLMGRTAEMLRDLGWEVRPEVSYSEYGERGSIDLLAWHPATRTLLVIEIKTELTSIEETLRKHGEKTRLASKVAVSQFAWRAAAVTRLLVLPSRPMARRRVARHEAVMEPAYPDRASALRQWFRLPAGSISGLIFIDESDARGLGRGGPRIGRKRIRAAPAR
jgi:transcriptional regulator with XRE-family HTH domain